MRCCGLNLGCAPHLPALKRPVNLGESLHHLSVLLSPSHKGEGWMPACKAPSSSGSYSTGQLLFPGWGPASFLLPSRGLGASSLNGPWDCAQPAPPSRSGFSPTFLQVRASTALKRAEGYSSGGPTLSFYQ